MVICVDKINRGVNITDFNDLNYRSILNVNYSSKYKSFNCDDDDKEPWTILDGVKYWAYADEVFSQFLQT